MKEDIIKCLITCPHCMKNIVAFCNVIPIEISEFPTAVMSYFFFSILIGKTLFLCVLFLLHLFYKYMLLNPFMDICWIFKQFLKYLSLIFFFLDYLSIKWSYLLRMLDLCFFNLKMIHIKPTLIFCWQYEVKKSYLKSNC